MHALMFPFNLVYGVVTILGALIVAGLFSLIYFFGGRKNQYVSASTNAINNFTKTRAL